MNWLRKRRSLIVQRLVLLGIFFLAWMLAAHNMPAFVLPGPQKTFQALLALWQNDTLLQDVSVTFSRVLSGFLLATLVGTLAGLALGASR